MGLEFRLGDASFIRFASTMSALSPCSARPPGSTLRVRKLTATNLEEILPEFDSKSTAAVPRDVPIDLEQISLDDGCGFLPIEGCLHTRSLSLEDPATK